MSAYEILLSEERDIDCIFHQKHPNSVAKMNEILADALIYGVELKGEEKYVTFRYLLYVMMLFVFFFHLFSD